MGVHGLWDLLAPVGRRVSVETLAGKRLAIDASIWMIQFMKAMRDERGDMVRNAHLLGFFRRICKLLFLRTKPVFVFDGGTPALKLRTVIARRRQREKAQAKIRKTAEKLLLNQLKAMKVRELAKELKSQNVKNSADGEKIMLDEANSMKEKDTESEFHSQETIDEMLAASLAAEECGALHHNAGAASTSASGNPLEGVDDEDDDEIIFPIIDGNVDPAVLATLPPSMQLDLLVQMRERLMAENRQKYQKVEKAPQRFSELQIESYLKTVAFRREIDEVQKAAAGKGVGGMQTARIASEADKEFIFSSSFTGDKQVLASAAVKNQNKVETEGSSLDIASIVASVNKSSILSVTSRDETVSGFGNDVRTYLDSERTRVSRMRAMGMRMTRDLQRNLDLMKEFEQDNITVNAATNTPRDLNGRKLVSDNFSEINGEKLFSEGGKCDHVSSVNNGITLEISFEDDEQNKSLDGNDNLFACLAAGVPVKLSSADDTLSKAQDLGPASDCEWEEGNIEALVGNTDRDSEMKPSRIKASNDNDEDELELQDGISNVEYVPCPAENSKHKSRGFLEEEAALQEALRRSLEDLEAGNITNSSNEMKRTDELVHLTPEDPVYFNSEVSEPRSHSGSIDVGSSCSTVCRSRLSDVMLENKAANTAGSSEMRSRLHAAVTGEATVVTDKPCDAFQCFDREGLVKNAGTSRSIYASVEIGERPCERICGAPSMSSQIAISTGTTLPDYVQLTFKHKSQNESEASLVCDLSKASVVINNQEEYMREPASQTDIKGKVVDVEFLDDLQERSCNVDLCGSAFDGGNTEVAGASLEDELQFLSEEFINLEDEQRKLERNADSVNGEMFEECQELLQMFGLPYIIAPMEAEAQCAYMELVGLVDGVVTDDSDVFLFGARSVYKNIFDDRKYVETYFMKDIENELGLTREKLIRMALLLGSDYTEGVSGIGIVNAIEVVNAFPEEDGLSRFREWIESPDPNILGTLDMHSRPSSNRKASMSVSKSDTKTLPSDGDDVKKIKDKQDLDNITSLRQIFMNTHRNVSKNWHIPSSFPSPSVVSAYTYPQVDKSTQPFSWGKPDLFGLRRLSWEKFGWGSEKVNELLLPVLKEYSKHETQMRLEAFYSFNEKFAKIRSKRIKQAVKGLTGNPPSEAMDDAEVNGQKSNIKKASLKDSAEVDFDDVNKISRGPRKRRAHKVPSVGNVKIKLQDKDSDRHGSVRLRKRGRWKSTSAVRVGEGKASPVSEFNDAVTSNAEHATQVESPHGNTSFGRSMCSGKAAHYAGRSNEVDENVYLLNEDNRKRFNNATKQQESFGDQSFRRDDNCADFSGIGNQNSEESLLDEGWCGDCLQKDGRFSADEDEAEREKVLMLDEDSTCVEVDGSYLETGGGFCIDDDNDTFDPDKTSGWPIGTACLSVSGAEGEKENSNSDKARLSGPSLAASNNVMGFRGSVSSGFEQNMQIKHVKGSGNCPREDENMKGNVNFPAKALSAMPYLRRKKRS